MPISHAGADTGIFVGGGGVVQTFQKMWQAKKKKKKKKPERSIKKTNCCEGCFPSA